MIKITLKAKLNLSVEEFRRLSKDDQIAMKIFDDIKSIERPDATRQNFVGEEYRMISVIRGKEYISTIKNLEIDHANRRSVWVMNNVQAETLVTSIMSGSENDTEYLVDYETTLKSPIHRFFEPFFAKGALTMYQQRVLKFASYFDPGAKVEVVKNSVWKMPIDYGYFLSTSVFFIFFLMAYKYIPKFDTSRFVNSKYEEADKVKKTVKVVFSFQQDFPDQEDVVKTLADRNFDFVFGKVNEEKTIQSLGQGWDEVVVVDVWLKDIENVLKRDKKKSAVIYTGGDSNLRAGLKDYMSSFKDFPEYSDFIVVGEPIGGTWNKSSIALKRNISAIQVGFDLNLLKTDKEYKNIVIRSLRELGYIAVGLLGVTGETASDCQPE